MVYIANKSEKDFSASIWDVKLISLFSKYLKFLKLIGDITNFEIIEEIIRTGKPVVVSTGLSSIKEIRNTISFIEKNNKNIKKKI